MEIDLTTIDDTPTEVVDHSRNARAAFNDVQAVVAAILDVKDKPARVAWFATPVECNRWRHRERDSRGVFDIGGENKAHESACILSRFPVKEDLYVCAAWEGRLEVIKWLRSRGCPWDEYACMAAVEGGHLETLKWLRAEDDESRRDRAAGRPTRAPCPWDSWTVMAAAEKNQVHIVEWLKRNGAPVPKDRLGVEVSLPEMDSFLALLLFMGIKELPTMSFIACPTSEEVKRAPMVAIDYNVHMGFCDSCNHMKRNYSLQQIHVRRWYMCILYFVLELSVINSLVIWRKLHPNANASF
ncbi:Ankyrin repeat domain-containing protein [Balamuthia mandrillaris]